MNKRIRNLRNQSLRAINRISAERALLVTQFYESALAHQVSVPLQRALAFKHIMEHKKICINKGELIVGERGPAPKATSTYPEICLHSLKDLDTLDKRPKVSFKVDEKTRNAYRDTIIPFWKGKTQRDRLFNAMDEEWLSAYDAGVFTEFQEQRAPGHTTLGDKIYHRGLSGLKEEIQTTLAQLDFYNDPSAVNKKAELQAMEIVADAMILYAKRHEFRPMHRKPFMKPCNHIGLYILVSLRNLIHGIHLIRGGLINIYTRFIKRKLKTADLPKRRPSSFCKPSG
jgi:formate C-acetyltransferase